MYWFNWQILRAPGPLLVQVVTSLALSQLGSSSLTQKKNKYSMDYQKLQCDNDESPPSYSEAVATTEQQQEVVLPAEPSSSTAVDTPSSSDYLTKLPACLKTALSNTAHVSRAADQELDCLARTTASVADPVGYTSRESKQIKVWHTVSRDQYTCTTSVIA